MTGVDPAGCPSSGAGHGEQGFGLLLLVGVLAVLGLLSLGAFAVARREVRSSADTGLAADAFELAESGLAVASAAAPALASSPPMVPLAGPIVLGERSRVATTLTRLTGTLVLLQSTGERLDGAGDVVARAALGLLGTLLPASDSAPARFRQLPSRGWMQLYW